VYWYSYELHLIKQIPHNVRDANGAFLSPAGGAKSILL